MAEPRGILDILANAGVPPEGVEALARGDQTWTEPDGSFWGMTTVDEPLEAPHQAPVHYTAGAGDFYLVQQMQAQQAKENERLAQQFMQQNGTGGGGDAAILAAQQLPQQQADWAQFEQDLERPDSLSWGAGNPVLPSGQNQFYPVWGAGAMRVIDRLRLNDWRPDPGEQYYSGSGFNSGRSLGFPTAFTLPGWSGGYQMVGFPGDIQGWIPRG